LLLVALTGNIASGKSTVARRLAERGAWLIDADELAREAVGIGTPGLAAIRERWGNAVIAPDGTLDRAALRRIVFDDSKEREALNAIVHPEVARLRGDQLARAKAARASVVVADIPLLYEAGLSGEFDLVVLVDAPESTRLERLVTRRGLSVAEARAMMDAQQPSSSKRARADLVIDNVGSLDSLRDATDAIWEKILEAVARDTGAQ
jgi:dephospho-CoA kinase